MTWLLLACGAPEPAPLLRFSATEGQESDPNLAPDTASGQEQPTTPLDTAAPETGRPPEPTDPTQAPTDTGRAPGSTDPGTSSFEACFLGPSRVGDACLPVFTLDPVPPEYAYPPPLDGDPQYAAPLRYLDLDASDPSLSLAPNFVLEELAQAWKGRWAVVQPHAVERIQALRDRLGPLAVNSGYRSPDYNAGVGGVTWSRHQWGDAFDLDPISADLGALADACEDEGASYVGVYETHIHCDWRDDPLEPAFFGEPTGLDQAGPPALSGQLRFDGERWWAPAAGWDEGEPLREWTAFNAQGAALAQQRGRSFLPPPGTSRVEVWVGRRLTLRAPQP